MTDLNALVIFAKIVEANSFSEAARRLHMPISTVSRRIADLEDRLGIRLLERTTRNLRLTDIGSELLVQARRGIELNEAVDNIVSDKAASVSGLLRLAAPPSISDTLVMPLVSEFQAAHPLVVFDIFVTDRSVDLIGDGIDLAFRGGPLRDSSLVARKLLTYRHQLVASPTYVAAIEPIKSPKDLLAHRLLAFSRRQPENRWTFIHSRSRKQETVSFQPAIAINDFAGLTPALLAGAGIGVLPPVVQPDLLRSGRLVEVMPAWRFRAIDFFLVHLGNRHIPRAVRAFKAFTVKAVPALFAGLPN